MKFKDIILSIFYGLIGAKIALSILFNFIL